MVKFMKQAKAPLRHKKTSSDARIGPDDWVRAGLIVLARDGIDAVRVEPLAERLGVTKGSFYWHFKDRAALHAAMLSAWRQSSTGEIIQLVEGEKPDVRLRLARLIELATSNDKAAGLETAMRAWAQHDPEANKILASVDGERLEYVAELLRGVGMDRSTAAVRARIVYLVLIGSYFAGSKTDLRARPDLWRELMKLIT